MTDDQIDICTYVHGMPSSILGLHGLMILTLSKLESVLDLASANAECLTSDQLHSVVNLGNRLTEGVNHIDSAEKFRVILKSLDHIYTEIETRVINQ